MTTTEDNEDQEALGVVRAALTDPSDDANDAYRKDLQAERILSALAEAGYTVVKTQPKPALTKCPGRVGSRPYWMGVDQWDPCSCILPPGHEGAHACEHTVPVPESDTLGGGDSDG